MEKGIKTQLKYYQFDSAIQIGPVTVDWFRYDLDENLEDRISRFSDRDANLLLNYVNNNSENFQEPNIISMMSKSEIPFEDIFDFCSDSGLGRVTFPHYLVLMPQRKLNKSISNWMYIELVNTNGEVKNNYNLPFGLVGRIIK